MARKIVVTLLAVLATLVAAGAGYQALGERSDRRAAPAPGRLVDVEGLSMHLHCTGSGGPTVVLEAGATGFAQTWAWIQDDLGQVTRVCSYDRAGMGWSAPTTGPVDGIATAGRLKALLDAAREPGPYVVVGHSLGGPLVGIFAGLHPDSVVGIGMVDPSHPDQLHRFPPEARELQERFVTMIGLAARLAPTGLMRATNLLGRSAEGLPDRDYRTARRLGASNVHLSTSHRELLAWDRTMAAAKAMPPPPEIPLWVISATEMADGMPEGFLAVNHALHADLAARSSRGTHRLLPASEHFSILMHEDDARRTAALLRELVAEARLPPVSAPSTPPGGPGDPG